MRILILATILALAGCQSGKGEHVDAKDTPISAENRVLDPGGAMSDPNAPILIGGNRVGPARERPKPEPLNQTVDKEPSKPEGHSHEGH